MPRKRFTSEQIISKLREAEIRLGQGETLPDICRALAVSEQTFDVCLVPFASNLRCPP